MISNLQIQRRLLVLRDSRWSENSLRITWNQILLQTRIPGKCCPFKEAGTYIRLESSRKVLHLNCTWHTSTRKGTVNNLFGVEGRCPKGLLVYEIDGLSRRTTPILYSSLSRTTIPIAQYSEGRNSEYLFRRFILTWTPKFGFQCLGV
jgi:hypothetical protein